MIALDPCSSASRKAARPPLKPCYISNKLILGVCGLILIIVLPSAFFKSSLLLAAATPLTRCVGTMLLWLCEWPNALLVAGLIMLIGIIRCPLDLCLPSVFVFVNPSEFFRALRYSREAV